MGRLQSSGNTQHYSSAPRETYYTAWSQAGIKIVFGDLIRGYFKTTALTQSAVEGGGREEGSQNQGVSELNSWAGISEASVQALRTDSIPAEAFRRPSIPWHSPGCAASLEGRLEHLAAEIFLS